MFGEGAFHALQGPEEIDGGWAGLPELVANRRHGRCKIIRRTGLNRSSPKRDAHRRRHPDGRGAANSELANRSGDGLVVPTVQEFHALWQSALIQEADSAILPFDGGNHRTQSPSPFPYRVGWQLVKRLFT